MLTPTRRDLQAFNPYLFVLSALFFVAGALIGLYGFFGARDIWQGIGGIFTCLFSIALWFAVDARQRHLPSAQQRLTIMSVLIAGVGVSIILDTLSRH